MNDVDKESIVLGSAFVRHLLDLVHERKEVLNVIEVSDYLGLSESIVRRLIREKKIPFNKIEGRYLFFLPVVREWLMKNSEQYVYTHELTEDKAKIVASEIWNTLEKGK